MDTTLDLEYNDDQSAIIAGIENFCTENTVQDHARHPERQFPRELWRMLAQLGVFAPGAPIMAGEGGGIVEICAICEALGRHVFPGPIQATYLAMQLLDDEEAFAVMMGDSMVCLSHRGDTVLPWGTEADIFLVCGARGITRALPPTYVPPVKVMGDETWGRNKLQVAEAMQNSARGLAVAHIATAAYLGAAAMRLISIASEHAAVRRQFDRPLAEFQAVSHPLADCVVWTTAAQTLTRTAACSIDLVGFNKEGRKMVECQAAGAAVSARRAALKSAFTCHQVLG
ncbi:MAG: acyl-CoA dehydrogenase family protein, partial [Halioglobus sp.]